MTISHIARATQALTFSAVACLAAEIPTPTDLALSRARTSPRHWVFGLPPVQQTNPVRIRVLTTDANGTPQPAEVLATCKPWGFRRHLGTDAKGELDFTGPIGDWSFAASVRTIGGACLVSTSRSNVVKDLAVRLRLPKKPTRCSFTSDHKKDLVDHLRKRPIGPGEECCAPRIYFMPMQVPGFSPTMSGGALSSVPEPQTVSVEVDSDTIVAFIAAPRPKDTGYALFARHRPGDKKPFPLDESKLATVVVDVKNDWSEMHLEIVGMDQEEVPVYCNVPLMSAGEYQIRVLPGVNRLGLRTKHGGFVPVIQPMKPGSRIQLRYAGPFQAKAEILRWDRGYLSVWFDITDRRCNYVNGFRETKAHLKLMRGQESVFDGEVTRSCGRVVEVIRDWGEDWAEKPLQYQYRLDSKFTGAVVSEGMLIPHATIDSKLLLVHKTPNFEVVARERTTNGRRVAQAYEAVHAAISATVAGPVHPSRGERFRVQCTSPFGIAWSSGDVVALDIYAAHWFWPTACAEGMLPAFHEFGHSYSMVRPGPAPNWGEDEGQGFATWVAYHGLRGAFGQRAYQAAREECNTALFMAPPGQPYDGFLFVLDYVDQRFGSGINRAVYRILYAGKGDLRKRVEQISDLKTEHERLAVVHSKLTSQNLAWLYRWGRLSVSDDTVSHALDRLNR